MQLTETNIFYLNIHPLFIFIIMYVECWVRRQLPTFTIIVTTIFYRNKHSFHIYVQVDIHKHTSKPKFYYPISAF